MKKINTLVLFVLVLAVSCTKRKVELSPEKPLAIRADFDEFELALEEDNVERVKSLIDLGRVGVNSRILDDPNRATLLHAAAEAGSARIVAYLLDNQAEVDALNDDNLSPLYLAAKEGRRDIVGLLLYRRASREERKEEMESKAVEYMGDAIDLIDGVGKTPLHWAAENGHKEVVEMLVEFAALVDKKRGLSEWTSYVNKTDKNERTPLKLAEDNGFYNVVRYLRYIQLRKSLSRFTSCFGNIDLELAFKPFGVGVTLTKKFPPLSS